MKDSQFSMLIELMSHHSEHIRQDQPDDVDSVLDVPCVVPKNSQVFEQQRRG